MTDSVRRQPAGRTVLRRVSVSLRCAAGLADVETDGRHCEVFGNRAGVVWIIRTAVVNGLSPMPPEAGLMSGTVALAGGIAE